MESGSWKAEAALGALVVVVLAAFVWLTFAVVIVIRLLMR